MAVSFNKEVILEAIQEVLAEGSKTVIVGNPSQTAQDIMNDPDVDSIAKKTAVDTIKKGMKGDKVEIPTKSMEEETISVGHIDDEPGMLKQFAFDTAQYAAKLYKLLHHYEQMEDHVDFPNWWQHKVMMAREYMSKATHYLEFEAMKPHIDAAVDGHSEEDLDEARDYQALVGKEVMFGSRLAAVVGEEGDYIRLKFEDGKENLVTKKDFENKQPGVNEEDEVEPSKKDIKAAEKETGGKKTHFTPEAQNMHNIIKNKVTKIEKKAEAGDDYKLDLAALKQYISKPEVRKALGAKHIKGMVSSIISETITEGVSCCGRCGRVHESAQDCKKPYISKDSPRHCKNKK